MVNILALHIARQAVGRVVGNANRFFLRVVGQHGQHRTKDLLPGNRHVVVDVGEYRRPHVVTPLDALGQPGSATYQLGTFLNTLIDQALNLVPLHLGYHGTHGGVLIGRVTNGHHGLSDLGRYRLSLSELGPGHQHA